jgi:hypothetical protein
MLVSYPKKIGRIWVTAVDAIVGSTIGSSTYASHCSPLLLNKATAKVTSAAHFTPLL